MCAKTIVRTALALPALAVTLGATPAPTSKGAGPDLPLHIEAIAVDLGSPYRVDATRVEITIERWSTDAERDRLKAALIQKGSDALMHALESVKPRVGYISTPTSLAWDLYYAHKRTMPDGSERLVIASDRPMRFYELANATRLSQYDFLFAELHLGSSGTGDGKLIPFAEIGYNKKTKTIGVENYTGMPVMLKDVKIVRK